MLFSYDIETNLTRSLIHYFPTLKTYAMQSHTAITLDALNSKVLQNKVYMFGRQCLTNAPQPVLLIPTFARNYQARHGSPPFGLR